MSEPQDLDIIKCTIGGHAFTLSFRRVWTASNPMLGPRYLVSSRAPTIEGETVFIDISDLAQYHTIGVPLADARRIGLVQDEKPAAPSDAAHSTSSVQDDPRVKELIKQAEAAKDVLCDQACYDEAANLLGAIKALEKK